mgnify:CR=1 FL=1
MASLKLTLCHGAAVGLVMHSLLEHGYSVWDHCSEQVEIVFPTPIPPRSITRVIPQYPSNKQFRHRQRLQQFR